MNADHQKAGVQPRNIKKVGIVAKTRLREAGDLLREIAEWLNKRDIKTIFEEETSTIAKIKTDQSKVSRDVLPHKVDMVLVLGGDGTLLAMANRIAQANVDIPILAINFGSLGFLTEITLSEIYSSLEAVLAGTVSIDYRKMLHSVISLDKKILTDRIVLNDVVITKSALSSIIDLSVFVDDQSVAKFRADGLIISSPTGSTAYNLAAGGPIVHPAVDALVITPIAPHTLTNRPVVIPSSSKIRVEPFVDGPNKEVFVSFDGQFGFQLHGNEVVSVEQSSQPLRVVRASARNYFAVLREKLKWSEL